jgi:hypothetical protein
LLTSFHVRMMFFLWIFLDLTRSFHSWICCRCVGGCMVQSAEAAGVAAGDDKPYGPSLGSSTFSFSLCPFSSFFSTFFSSF